jgi:hypothetical protein
MEKFSDIQFENTAPLILEAELVIKEGFWNNVEFVNYTVAIKVLTFLNSVSYQNTTSLTTNAVGVEKEPQDIDLGSDPLVELCF